MATEQEYTFKKILDHPNRDDIISRLSNGDSTRTIAEWLKLKYPEQKELHLTHNILDKFRRTHLNIHGTLLQDLKDTVRDQEMKHMSEEMKEVVKTNKTYVEKLQEAVQTQVDWKTRLMQFMNIVETRFSQLYDITQENPSDYRPDKTMMEWMGKMLSIVQEIRKLEGAPDQVIQHNVTVQTIDEQSHIIQQAIIKTIEELNWEQSSILIDKFNKNIEELRVKETNIFRTKEDMEHLDKLTSKLLAK